MALSFDKLPEAVNELHQKLDNIERLLLEKNKSTQPEEPQILTIKQAAALIGLTVPTIYGLVNRGEIPVCKRGNRLYFLKSDLIDWIKGGRKKTITEIATDADRYIDDHKKQRW